MQDVSKKLFGYLEAKRHLWNTYFINKVNSIKECSALDDYEEIDKLLFSALVIADLGKTLPSNFILGKDPISFLRIVPHEGIDRLSAMLSQPSTGKNRIWSKPMEISTDLSDEFLYIEFFEWDRYGFVTYPYYLTRIKKTKKQPDIIGMDALIETVKAKVVFCDTE